MNILIIVSLIIIWVTNLTGQSAEEHLNNAKEIFGKSSFGDTYNRAKAVEECTKAINIDPNFTEAYMYRGNIKGILLDHKGAIKDYSKVIELEPENETAYTRRGTSYNFSKQYSKALNDFNMAIKLAGDNIYALSNLYCFRGFTKIGLNLKNEACEDFSKAGELGNSAAYDLIKIHCN
jgi:tetratricopeptide (TPR) repeat protein